MQRRVCRVCARQHASYTCPRCNTPYCALACYRSHSQQCTEAFAKEQALQQLRGTRAGKQERRNMVDILKRAHAQGQESEEEEDEDGSGAPSLLSDETMERLIRKMQEQGDLSADDLSPAERAAFERAIVQGQLSDLLDDWTPWWQLQEASELRLNDAGQPLVTHVVPTKAAGAAEGAPPAEGATSSSGGGNASSAEPMLPTKPSSSLPAAPAEPLPPLSALTKARPSPLLRWQLIELLYAYCHMQRSCNGDAPDDPQGAAEWMLQLAGLTESPGAGAAGEAAGGAAAAAPAAAAPPPESAAVAVLNCLSRATAPPLGHVGMSALAVALLQDVVWILENGRSSVLLALTDAKRVLDAAAAELAPAGGSPAVAGGSSAGQQAARRRRRRELQAAGHKLYFFAVWANEQPEELFQGALALAVTAEWQQLQQALGDGGGSASPAARGAAAAGGGAVRYKTGG